MAGLVSMQGVGSSYRYITALSPRIYKARWTWCGSFFPWSLFLVPRVLVQIYSHVVSALVLTLPFPFLVLGSFPLASQSQIKTVHVDLPSPRDVTHLRLPFHLSSLISADRLQDRFLIIICILPRPHNIPCVLYWACESFIQARTCLPGYQHKQRFTTVGAALSIQKTSPPQPFKNRLMNS